MANHENSSIEIEVLGKSRLLTYDDLRSFAEGRHLALKARGVDSGGILGDNESSNGVLVVVRAADGSIVGGSRICDRQSGAALPIESEASPVPEDLRAGLVREPGTCELGGLWIAQEHAGRFLSRKLVARTIDVCYELGHTAIISLAHWHSFKFIGEPLGFRRDETIPALPYPDERYQTVVIRHCKP